MFSHGLLSCVFCWMQTNHVHLYLNLKCIQMQLEHLQPSLGCPGMQSLSLWLIRPRQHRLPDASMINTLLKPHYTAFHDWLARVAHITPNEVIWCHAIFISSSQMQPTLSNLQNCYSNLETPDWLSVSLLLFSVTSYHFSTLHSSKSVRKLRFFFFDFFFF